MRRRGALLVILVAGTLAVSSCGSDDEAPAGSQGGKSSASQDDGKAESSQTPRPANGY